MKNTILFLVIMGSCMLTACNDEDKLTPTERPEFGYAVPQGDHDYDKKIVDWYNRCNFFILYDFLPRDIYWSVNGWLEAREREDETAFTWFDGWLSQPANEQYVGQQLELVEDQFLRFYPDSVLKRCMPLKILLCGELGYMRNTGLYNKEDVFSGYDHLAVNWGNESILNITADSVTLFKNNVNYAFLTRLRSNGKMVDAALFYNISDYSVAPTFANRYERGFLAANMTAQNDWNSFLQAVLSTPYSELTAAYPTTDRTNKGILNAAKDVNGLIRRKYDIMTSHYKETYGIDIQAIGNAVTN